MEVRGSAVLHSRAGEAGGAVITYSLGLGISDNHPQQRESADFAAFGGVLRRNRAKFKAKAGYICGPLNGDGRRCAEGALPRRWVAVDADKIDPESHADFRMWFARFSGLAWPTHSSKPAAPRERVIIELSREATRDECIAVGAVLARDLTDEFGPAVVIDPSTFRGEQPVFLPPEGVSIATFSGDPLDVDAYLQQAAPTEVLRQAAKQPAGDTIDAIRRGEDLHENVGRLVARMAAQGVNRETIEAAAVGLAERARAARGQRVDDFTGAELQRLIDGAIQKFSPGASDQQGVPFVRVPIADLHDFTPPAPEHVWQDYIPVGVVTLLGAHGGAGKSTLALLLAVCTALGVPCLGVPTRRCVVVFYSAEDSSEVLRHRLHWICKAMSVDIRDLAGWLHILDATGGDPTLYTETQAGGTRAGRTTPAYADLADYVREVSAGLLIVDNSSDTYAASEIDRARVREFMRFLARIAREARAGLLLLAHINKVKARGLDGSAESYSGSTAWHNSARSRLALDRTDEGLVLKHEKANLGPMRAPLSISWPQGGLMHVQEQPTGMMAVIVDRNETKALLRLIHEFTERGESVSTATTSRTHAGKLLGKEPTYPKNLDEARLFDLLRIAERKGQLKRETYRGADRKQRERWIVTPEGLAQAGIAATAATCATTEVTASDAVAREPAATAATSPLGGVGEERAQKSPQIEGVA